MTSDDAPGIGALLALAAMGLSGTLANRMLGDGGWGILGLCASLTAPALIVIWAALWMTAPRNAVHAMSQALARVGGGAAILMLLGYAWSLHHGANPVKAIAFITAFFAESSVAAAFALFAFRNAAIGEGQGVR